MSVLETGSNSSNRTAAAIAAAAAAADCDVPVYAGRAVHSAWLSLAMDLHDAMEENRTPGFYTSLCRILDGPRRDDALSGSLSVRDALEIAKENPKKEKHTP